MYETFRRENLVWILFLREYTEQEGGSIEINVGCSINNTLNPQTFTWQYKTMKKHTQMLRKKMTYSKGTTILTN